MESTPISNHPTIKVIHYDPATRTMTVETTHGNHSYIGVSKDRYEKFVKDPTKSPHRDGRLIPAKETK